MVKKADSAERTCIASGETRPKGQLIRFVVGPDEQLVPDLAQNLPGRGIWLTASRDALEKALKKKAFARAAKAAIRIDDPETLAGMIEALLSQRALQYLGLANKAGLVVTGFNKVEPLLRAGKAALLLGAVDASEDGRRKLAGLRGEAPVHEILSGRELDAVLGKENVVHVALKAGGLTEKLIAELDRLSGFRGATGSRADPTGH